MNDTDTQALGRSLADTQQQLEDDGYMVVAELCDPSFVAQLLEVSLHRSGTVMAMLGAKTIGIGSAAGFDEAAEPALKALAYHYRRPAP